MFINYQRIFFILFVYFVASFYCYIVLWNFTTIPYDHEDDDVHEKINNFPLSYSNEPIHKKTENRYWNLKRIIFFCRNSWMELFFFFFCLPYNIMLYFIKLKVYKILKKIWFYTMHFEHPLIKNYSSSYKVYMYIFRFKWKYLSQSMSL